MKAALSLLFLSILLCICPVSSQAKDKEPAHWAARGAAEIGLGAVLGAAGGGSIFITGLLLNPNNYKTTLVISGIVYPAAVASGAILGGYITDSRSTYWEPFVGAYAGAIVADITSYFLSDDYPVFTALLVLILPIVTTTVAMEASHARRSHSSKRPAAATTYMPLSYSFSF
jgi:hypothetical protein